jgi:hypothetical protein
MLQLCQAATADHQLNDVSDLQAPRLLPAVLSKGNLLMIISLWLLVQQGGLQGCGNFDTSLMLRLWLRDPRLAVEHCVIATHKSGKLTEL